MQQNTLPQARNSEIIIQGLLDEVLVYDLKNNKAYCLNQTAAFIWKHADGRTPVKQIAYLLQKELGTPIDESIVWFALENLEKDGLLENSISAPQMFAGMNRRQLISAFGKSAAILPLVFAITAPAPIAAASGQPLANGVVCSSGSQCTSGNCSGSTGRCCSSSSGTACTTHADCCVSGQICSGNICATSSGGCLLYDTPITTADGQTVKAIDVFAGQELLGINCINGEMIAGKVKGIEKLSSKGFYSFLAESGDVVQCSPSHPLIRGFGDEHGTNAEEFRVGDSLLVLDKQSNRIVEAKTAAIEYVKVPQSVIFFEMDTVEHTFVSGGIVSHNRAKA